MAARGMAGLVGRGCGRGWWRGGWRGGWIGVVACAALAAGAAGVVLGVQIGAPVGWQVGAPVGAQVGDPVGVDAGGEGVKMDLGYFSVKLSVYDVEVSQAFYEKLGFAQIRGDVEEGWVFMQNGTTTIGLFRPDLIWRNGMTFQPGWNHKGERVEGGTDVREIQRTLIAKGIVPAVKVDETSARPAAFGIEDPDGNPIVFTWAERVAEDAGGEGVKMELGNFSLSLAVKEIGVSRAFYEKLGFVQIGGDMAQGWVIMQSGTTTIGLFQGMFERNIMTFNPGWNHKGEKLEAFTDVRELQRALIAKGIEPNLRADEGSTGPASFVIEDPDGNPILFDQHVGRE